MELKQKECSKLKSETEATQGRLLEQVTKSGATQKELEAKLAGKNKEKIISYKLELGNNLLMFQLNAPVVIASRSLS